LSSVLSRLMVTVERYPDLKANANFMDLQNQLEGTENRISVERRRFNEAAQGYNATIRSFPASIIAGMFGFDKKAYFAASEAAQDAPTVDFGK
ncbi:LemA family protein, partial [bacterium]|nr:LemA family protein [bacterium]